jgi:hypothetical protein
LDISAPLETIASCPWSAYAPDPFPVCEEHLCALIVQPCNTWTNVSYLIVSLIIWNSKNFGPKRHAIGLTVFLVAICSTLFHLTATLIGKQLDIGAMMTFSSLCLTYTVMKTWPMTRNRAILLYALLVLSGWALMGDGRQGTGVFMLHVLMTFILEFKNAKKNGVTSDQKKLLAWALGLFLFALLLNALDLKKILCIPSNHIMTGHGFWHLVCGVVIWLVARYYCYWDDPTKQKPQT